MGFCWSNFWAPAVRTSTSSCMCLPCVLFLVPTTSLPATELAMESRTSSRISASVVCRKRTEQDEHFVQRNSDKCIAYSWIIFVFALLVCIGNQSIGFVVVISPFKSVIQEFRHSRVSTRLKHFSLTERERDRVPKVSASSRVLKCTPTHSAVEC